ncbi:unnamed protein product [Heterotrigona itama]|uniref:Uncharacterized protein n=1 Tax=Heterotrigona itama TaxID=395501 RepID=A0A6V7GWQ0_9HYME|nr:unnamed protein product [Heterotrigona itama]
MKSLRQFRRTFTESYRNSHVAIELRCCGMQGRKYCEVQNLTSLEGWSFRLRKSHLTSVRSSGKNSACSIDDDHESEKHYGTRDRSFRKHLRLRITVMREREETRERQMH